jgi:hypothetical protein
MSKHLISFNDQEEDYFKGLQAALTKGRRVPSVRMVVMEALEALEKELNSLGIQAEYVPDEDEEEKPRRGRRKKLDTDEDEDTDN